MQRFQPAVGLLALVMLMSSMVGGAVAATGDFGSAGLLDRPELARPEPQDESSGIPECPRWTTTPNAPIGTCVTIRNQTSRNTLVLLSLRADPPSVVHQQAPPRLGPGQSGTWITGGPDDPSSTDNGHARYRILGGPISAIEYATGAATGTLAVTVVGTTTASVPYCTVTSRWRFGQWMSRVITYSDTGRGTRGACHTLVADATAEPAPTPTASPDTPAPAAALTPAPVPPDSAAPPSTPGVGGSSTVGPPTAPMPLVSPTPASQPAPDTPEPDEPRP